ncbi:MAG TPA: peptidase E, partial [Thermoleophilaceae bacterium]
MTRRPRRILVSGGGGFTTSVQDLPLDHLGLELVGVQRPRICLLPTASGDPEDQISRFYSTFRDTGAELCHVSLFRLGNNRTLPLAEQLLAQDVIYAGGGSMVNLLALWGAHEIGETLAEAWRRGVLLCGVSAGAMCWFEGGVTRSHGPPRPARGLGLLPGSLSVHDDVDPERAAAYRDAVLAGALDPGYALDDGVGLLFEDGRPPQAFSARLTAGARRVSSAGGRLHEQSLELELLDPLDAATTVEPSITELRELREARRGHVSAA